jgi:hypothetical protein
MKDVPHQPEAPTGRNPIRANTVRMPPLQSLNVCPSTFRRAMPDAIDINILTEQTHEICVRNTDNTDNADLHRFLMRKFSKPPACGVEKNAQQRIFQLLKLNIRELTAKDAGQIFANLAVR